MRDQDEQLKVEVLSWFGCYEKAENDYQREEAMRSLVVITFSGNEEEMDETIKSIPGRQGEGRYWRSWFNYLSDNQEKIIGFVELSKKYLHGGIEEMFVDLLFQLEECEHQLLAAGKPLKYFDDIAGRLANALDCYYSDEWKSKMALRLRASPMGKFHAAFIGTKFDMKRELAPMVPVIFSSKEELDVTVEEILRRTEGPNKAMKARAEAVIEFLKDNFSQA